MKIVVVLEIIIIIFYVPGMLYYLYTVIYDRVSLACISIKSIANSLGKAKEISEEQLVAKLELIYGELTKELPRFNTFFPNIVTWINCVVSKLEIRKNLPDEIKDNNGFAKLRAARDIIEKQFPYAELNQVQQSILIEIDSSNGEEKEFNLSKRLYEEFCNQNKIEKKVRRQEIISNVIGLTGILISILMGVISIL